MPADGGHLTTNAAANTLALFDGWARSQVQRLTRKPGLPEEFAPVATARYFGDAEGKDINGVLRGNAANIPMSLYQQYTSLAQQIDSEFRASPFALAAGQELYRGIDHRFAASLVSGAAFTDHGYVSTSSLRSQAGKKRHSQVTETVVATIRLTQPTKTLIHRKEAEFLLPRGMQFRVVSRAGERLVLEATPPEAFRKGP